MKRIRRESSIFSLSAIDLFASALGAFIVVALVLLPYFPNTSDVEASEVDALRAQAAEAEAERDAAERELAEARHAARSTVQALPPIDLVIALDTTGSMTDEVASLREEIAGLAELLVDLTEDAAVGIIDFEDGCGPAPVLRTTPLLRVDRASALELSAFARTMRPGSACNNTADEDFAEALQAAIAAAWRPGSEYRSIVLITDNPAHSHLRAQAVADAGRFAARAGARHTVSTVFVDLDYSGLRSHPDTAGFLRQVAEAGNGQFVRSSENASLSMTILSAIFG